MPMPDEELRELAEGATPGPWAWEPVSENDNGWCLGVVWNDDDRPLSGQIEKGQGEIVEHVCEQIFDSTFANAAYIAAASPDRILALLDRLARVEALADEWHEVVQSIVNNDAPSIRHREVLRSVVIDLRAALSAPTHTEDEGVE